MSADLQATVQDELHRDNNAAQHPESNDIAANEYDEDKEESEDEVEEEDEDEPRLKYAKLTGSLTNVYRNGDSTSAFVVAGDKMVLGTHNGNVHVLSLPSLQSLRTYHAHSATITSISISPTPPPPRPTSTTRTVSEATSSIKSPPASIKSTNFSTGASRSSQARTQQPSIPNTPNNQIHVATSSLDGHVCVSHLIDTSDVQLRNFARPVQAVVLSPDYRSDRMFLSGGLAGQLILTTGGKAGVTVDANTNSAAAAASGWLGSIGLGADRGRDEVLHSGEGSIREIKWSNSGKWVAWVNEEGIKIMRSHLRLGSEEEEDRWTRIAHAPRPNKTIWAEMSGVWRARAEWVDDKRLETDDVVANGAHEDAKVIVNGTTSSSARKKRSRIEKLIVGWGNTAFILHVHEGGTDASGKRQVGSAEIVKKFHFGDCIVSGISLHTPSLLAILAYRTTDDDGNPVQQNDKPRKGRHHRQTSLAPQLRLVDVHEGFEVDVDELSISRFETLSAQDYHLGTLFIPPPPPQKTSSTAKDGERGALEGFWDAAGGKYATRMFSSGASMVSQSSSGGADVTSPPSSAVGVAPPPGARRAIADAHPYAAQPGLKLIIQSPYDCVLAVKRDPADRLGWLLERKQYEEAWGLVDAHPEVVQSSTATEKVDLSSQPSTPSRAQGGGGSLADFLTDDSGSQQSGAGGKFSLVEKEKRRIGDLWLQQLVADSSWEEAGKVAGKVLGTSTRWEHWVWTFAQADKFDEITPYIPSATQLPGMVYEVVLGHYVQADPKRLEMLLEKWEPAMGGLYDVGSISKAIEARLGSEDEEIKQGSDDWRTLTECLAKLYLADGRIREALKCWIQTQNADEAFRLIVAEKAVDVVDPDDVPGLLMLRVSSEMMQTAGLQELEEASSEAMQLLVDEAHRGSLMPRTVIRELQASGPRFKPFMFFYFRALWKGKEDNDDKPKRIFDKRVGEGRMMVEDHADLAVELFAEYDRELLMLFLRASSVYSYEKAAALCEHRDYIPELVYVLSKTGQTKLALSLIIDRLGDVSKAIAFTKENPDLWPDLLDYSMDKPAFIVGLLEEIGTAIEPIQLLRRIPAGLEIEGLKKGIQKMMQEYEIQASISEGVARVLRGEVGMGMEIVRAGRGKGVRFEVMHESAKEVDLVVRDPLTLTKEGERLLLPNKEKVEKHEEAKQVKPGHCVGCGDVFHEDETSPLIGFACGHVYHLSCLLRANPTTNDPETLSRLESQFGYSYGNDNAGGRGSVGAKVAHAHIIKNVLKGGCRHCSLAAGA